MSEQSAIAICRIRLDGGTQPRAAISEATVAEYAERIHAGDVMPPLDVFFDGVEYWLADGFHRYHATQRLGKEHVRARVHTGTRRDAVLFSVGVNRGHGLQRTNEDKRKAVGTLLSDSEWAAWSDHEIAKRCGVSSPFVGDVRRGYRTRSAASGGSLVTVSSEPQQRTYTTKHGTEATMNVEEIGKTKRPERQAPAPDAKPSKSREAVAVRRDRMREMAKSGHTSRQIAAAVGMSEESCRNAIKGAGIDVPADRVAGGLRRHDSTRIMEHIVMDAENLTADVNLIDFEELHQPRLAEWIASLNRSKKALESFIRQLVKESEKHGEAA